ncbi:MAG: branched-chain amino acid ABC transporter permease [Oscillospiraceae bacterium]|jgi:branched-chain amino acid transport system permease protein|nr:branched-chain amino acid ABC transporter permease [Oscillospiraceae bacterium]
MSLEPQPLFLRIYRNHHLRYIVFGLIFASLPYLSNWGFIRVSLLTTVASIIIYAIAALGLNLLLGYSGLVSLGTAGFMGLGAYIGGYLINEWSASVWIAILVALLIPTLVGILVGLVSLRIAGIYLAIATLCVSEILLKTFAELESFTGGMRGLTIRFPVILGVQMNRELMFMFVVIALIIMMMLTHNLVSGQFGRAMHAMRGSESAARAMGINLFKYRLIVFAISTAYAGLAGMLYVLYIRSSYPTTWDIMLSLNLVAIIIIGGLRSIYGTVIGAFVVFGMSDLVLRRLPIIGDMAGIPYVITGVLIVVMILFYPNGIRYIPQDIKKLIRKITKRGVQNV